METGTLSDRIQDLTRIQPLTERYASIVEDFPETISVRLHTRRFGEKDVSITGLAPYHTLEDLHRTLWLQTGKSSETYPSYSFIVVETEKGVFGLTELFPFPLPNPETAVRSPQGIKTITTEEGERLPLSILPRGRVLLEEFFFAEETTTPSLHLYSLDYLVGVYQGAKPIAIPEWNRRFWPYFPSLDSSSTGILTPKDVEVGKLIESVLQAKLKQAEQFRTFLQEGPELTELSTTAVRLLSFQWLTPKPDLADAEGVDALFFSRSVSEQRPFMRLVMPNQTPLTKLYQPDRMSLPFVHDAKLLKKWAEERNPIPDESILFVKIPLRDVPSPGYPQLYATLRILDDRTADIVIQPPVGFKSLSIQSDLKDFGTTVSAALEDILPADSVPKIARANLSVELKFDELPPKTIRTTVKQRLLTFSTLFQETIPTEEEKEKYFLTLRYKGVSNFTTPSTIESFLTYVISRKGVTPETSQTLIPMLSKEFTLSTDEALKVIQSYFKDSTEVSTADDDRQDFLATHNPGIDIGIQSNVGNTFTILLFNVRSIRIIDIQRILTLIQLAFKGDYELWNDAPATQKDVAQTAKAAAQLTTEARVLERIVEADEAALEEEGEEGMNSMPMLPERIQDREAAGVAKVPAPKEEGTKLIAHHWYVEQLKKLDKLLFTTGKDTKKDAYTRKCAENEGRQPVGLSQEQFNTMIRLYSRSDPSDPKRNYIQRVGFIVYGEKETQFTPRQADGKPEKFWLMRYGTNPTNLFYVFCPEFFCLRDMMPLLEDDYDDTKDYYNEPKPAESCPFCHGTKIKDPSKPGEGETILMRKRKLQDKKLHQYIGFLKNPHPDGFGLPCCFVANKSTADYKTSPLYKHIRDREAKEDPRAERIEKEALQREKLADAHQGRRQEVVPYDVLLYNLSREYVLGPEKWPLEAGKIGMPSLAIDSLFGQDSTQFVGRAAIKQEFKPNVNGLFRLGVLNKPQYASQSLFAALCPLLGVNTIDGVGKYIVERISPRVFLNLNFGNLVLEFYDPANDGKIEKVQKLLRTWASRKFVTAKNKDFELRRLYTSYHAFVEYVLDPRKPKLLRHFYHALAEPGLLTTNGLLLIPIQYRGNPSDAATKVEINCPLLGYDANRYAENDIAFITHSETGIWEPLMYVANLNSVPSATAQKSGTYTLSQSDLQSPYVPSAIKAQYQEFTRICRSAYRGAFTYQAKIENRLLEPVSSVIERMMSTDREISGIVRDSYNHLVAVTIQPSPESSGEVLVPVVDDGYSFHDRLTVPIYLTLETVPKPSAGQVESVYTQLSSILTPINQLYKLIKFLASSKGIFAYVVGDPSLVQITLPCGPLAPGERLSTPVQVEKGDTFEFQYQIDRELQLEASPTVEPLPPSAHDSFVVGREQIDEIYEHLRVTFANHIATTQSATTREEVKELLKDKTIAKFEKLNRLAVLFGGLIQTWFLTTDEKLPSVQILLRKDCIKETNPGQCDATKGICAWDGESNTCKIHTPGSVMIRSSPEPQSTDAVTYFTRRLFDEILRLPARATELLENKVKRVRIPTTNVHVGNAWILPENVPAWYELLRTGVTEEGREVPRYYEEFSRKAESPEEEDAEFALQKLISIRHPQVPIAITNLIQKEFQSRLALKLVQEPGVSRTQSILNAFDVRITLDSVGSSSSFLPNELSALSQALRKPIVQVTVSDTGANPLGVTYGPLTERLFPSVVAVLFPDLPIGPAILYDIQDKDMVVPALFVEGPIFNSLNYFVEQEKELEAAAERRKEKTDQAKMNEKVVLRTFIRRKPKAKPAEAA